MEWLKFPVSLTSDEMWVSAPARACKAWISLALYCARNENGGRIVGCLGWGNEEWLRLVGVKGREVEAVVACGLARWDGARLVVERYDSDGEKRCQETRGKRKDAARARWDRYDANASAHAEPKASAHAMHGTERNERDVTEREETDDELLVIPDADAPSDRGSDESRWPYEHSQPYIHRLKGAGAQPGKGTWRAWKRLVEKYGIERVCAAVDRQPANHRWPNDAETVLEQDAAATAGAGEDPLVAKADALLAAFGWVKCREVLGLPGDRVASESDLRAALGANRALMRQLAERAA